MSDGYQGEGQPGWPGPQRSAHKVTLKGMLITVAMVIALLAIVVFVSLATLGDGADWEDELQQRDPLPADVARAEALDDLLSSLGMPVGWSASASRPSEVVAGDAELLETMNRAVRYFVIAPPQRSHLEDMISFVADLSGKGWTVVDVYCEALASTNRSTIRYRLTNTVDGVRVVLRVEMPKELIDGNGRAGLLQAESALAGSSLRPEPGDPTGKTCQ